MWYSTVFFELQKGIVLSNRWQRSLYSCVSHESNEGRGVEALFDVEKDHEGASVLMAEYRLLLPFPEMIAMDDLFDMRG